MARKYKVSPDGDSVAVSSDYPADGSMAYGVMNAINGGHWASEEQLAGWSDVTELAAPPEPPAPEEPTP